MKTAVIATGAIVVCLATAAVVTLATTGGADPSPSRSAGPAFGVLASSCDPERLRAERAAGITVVEFDMGWDQYEPREGVFDASYADQLKGRFAACRNAGMRLVLSLGLQSPPSWVHRLQSGTLREQGGQPPVAEDQLDLVFSQTVRQAVATYFARVAKDIGFDDVLAIRLGTGPGGEFGYPGPDDAATSTGNSYWAFNDAAQTGDGLAEGISPSPLPGWAPGDAEWQGEPVTEEQVASWFSWYSRAPVSAIGWQADQLRALGFHGDFHLPIAGSGALPSNLQAAVAGHLDGRNDPFGALPRGLNYPYQFSLLSDLDRRLRADTPDHGIAVDFTGLDDITAVTARSRTTAQDACRPDDPAAAMAGAGVEDWSGQRFTLAVARHFALDALGENPGAAHLAGTGGASDSDSVAEQLTRAIAYARQCDLHTFLFAFEDQLFDRSSGVDLAAYQKEIDRR